MTALGADTDRIAALRDAEAKAAALFDEVVARGLVVPGKTERELSDEVRDLGGELFGIRRYWHKRIVRAGVNTLEPYRSNPPDRVLGTDEILFFDFGPIFEEWEADFGRTYVIGDDPAKHRLVEDLPRLWELGREHFAAHPDLTCAAMFAHMTRVIADAGWGSPTTHTGHLVGEFPHEKVNGDEIDSYITAGNDLPMRRLDRAGRPCHWILELHVVDRERGFGGFHEQLLDI